MGRKKNFSREGVLDRALPVFWTHGFADTSLQDLELATGVNKSGLYSEFKDKEDLFLASLKHYLAKRHERGLLTIDAPGWSNVERFLKMGFIYDEEQKGCFSVNSMREVAVLPDEARAIMEASGAELRRLIAWNIQAAAPQANADALADMALIFFFGICMEQNMGVEAAASTRKVDDFLAMLKGV
jgi:AcrR family transcriptional regulator